MQQINKDELIVQLADELKNLKSARFRRKYLMESGRKVQVITKLNSDGLELKEIDSTSSTDLLKTTNYSIGKHHFKAEKNTKPNKSDRRTHKQIIKEHQ